MNSSQTLPFVAPQANRPESSRRAPALLRSRGAADAGWYARGCIGFVVDGVASALGAALWLAIICFATLQRRPRRASAGAGIDGNSNRLRVAFDEVMVFDRALTPAEISQVINATQAP